MNCKKNCKTMAMFLILGILAAADTENIGDTDTRKSMERLQTNTVAYSDYHVRRNEPLHYTLLQPANNDITMKDLLNLQGKLYGEKPMNKIMTMITIEKRDREIINSKDTDMENFISAMQQYIANENVRSINVGNLTVTFDLVEDEYMTGYKMIKSIQEELVMTGNNLNATMIENLGNFYLEAFKHWAIQEFYGFIPKIVSGLGNKGKQKTDQIIGDYFKNNYLWLCYHIKEMFDKIKYIDIGSVMENCGLKLCTFFQKAQDYENTLNLKFFTENPKELDNVSKHLLWNVYNWFDKKNMGTIAKECLISMRDSENAQNSKKAFSKGCRILLQRFKNKNSMNKADAGNDDEACKNKFNEVYEKFFEDIGFKSIQEDFAKIECSELDTLHKRIVKQPGTRICINEKISIDMFYDFLRILDAENVFENLVESKSLIIDRGRIILCHGKKANGSDEEYVLRSKNGIEYKLNVCEGLECNSKTIEPNQKWSFETDLVGDRSIEISVNEMYEADFDIPLGVQMLESKCLEENKSKLTGRCKIAVKNIDFLTEIYILDHRKEHGEDKNLTSVIFDNQTHNHSETCFAADKTTRDIICLDNVPLPYLDTLIDSLQISQITRPTQFTAPNIQTGENNYIYIFESYAEHNGYTDSFTSVNEFEKVYKKETRSLGSEYISLPDRLASGMKIRSLMTKWYAKIKIADYSQENFKQTVMTTMLNIDTIYDDINDPCTILCMFKSFHMECLVTPIENEEPLLHVCAVRVNDKIDPTINTPVKIIKKILNFKNRKLVHESLNTIAKAMEADKDLVPLVFDEICNQMRANFSGINDDLYCLDTLQRIGRLFGYSEKWIEEKGCDSDKTSGVELYSEDAKFLIGQSIRNLLGIVQDADHYKENLTHMKITSAVKLAKVTHEGINPLMDAKTMDSMTYGNLTRFKAAYLSFKMKSRKRKR